MLKLKVWDLDSTLVNTKHRYRNLPGTNKIDLLYWKEMATKENIAKDKVIAETIPIYRDHVFCSDSLVVICTARVMSEHDFNFVNEHLPGYDFLLSRDGENDCRSDWKLKQDKLLPLVREIQPTCKKVYDDNVEVLEILHYFGFKCFQSIFDGITTKLQRF